MTLHWNTTTQPGATFLYTVTWKPEWINWHTGMPYPNTTMVRWFKPDGVTYATDAVQGRACLAMNTIPGDNSVNPPAAASYLPTPYGTLAQNVVASDTTIAVLADPANVPLTRRSRSRSATSG